jgi:hypothetical protein
VKLEVEKGNEVKEAAVRGAEIRMRPIFITSLTLMAGAFAILQDPIFNGMAISLLFGAGVATVMALLVIPLGCISARKQFYVQTSDDGTVSVSPLFTRVEKEALEAQAAAGPGTPLLMRLWGGIFSMFSWVFYILRAVFTMIGMGLKGIFGVFGRKGGGTPPPPRPAPPGGTPPPPRGGGTPPPPREAPPAGGTPPPPREQPAMGKGTPPPREQPAMGKGTAPPPREAPPAGGTPPPPREQPPSVAGTAPPPRETPPAGGTPPPPREQPPATAGTPPPPREVPAEEPVVKAAAGAVDTDTDEDDVEEPVTHKRRGIRLKQDLN